MGYQEIQTTIYKLMNIRELLLYPENWSQDIDPEGNGITLCGAFAFVGVDTTEYQQYADQDDSYAGDLARGQVPEPVWFMRQAINKIAPEFGGRIYEWNKADGRTHDEVVEIIDSSIMLAKVERYRLFISDARFDTSDLILDRWGEKDGSRLCAMSSVSKLLGYETLTDMPWEVDPALAALVNLLNDRGTDESRQMLVSRITSIPFSGRTNITSLISRVVFPNVLIDYGYRHEAQGLNDCIGQAAFADFYKYLSERLTKPDGTGTLALGCITLATALTTSDPVKQDLLAVTAVSQIIGFEEGWWWLGLLAVLDYIIGTGNTTTLSKGLTLSMLDEYFLSPRTFSKECHSKAKKLRLKGAKREEYETEGIKVRYFPALEEKFLDRMGEIVHRITQEVENIGQTNIELHRFKFEDEEIIITTYWDELYKVLEVDADLVAYQEIAGELVLKEGDKATPVLVPIPASEAKTIH
jgi:hypothetical protein